jgi:4-hydroxyphenylpyruvate dioxygenase-like putative hemolysin
LQSVQEHKQQEILAAEEDMDKFRKLGLLIDSEADLDFQQGIQDRFLIQIFTKPLFYPPQNTFFLEILERRGARGFGSGNITALAKSIILQQQQQEREQARGSAS